jgi:RNA polymerase sigma-70 factor, ECF subfamily
VVQTHRRELGFPVQQPQRPSPILFQKLGNKSAAPGSCFGKEYAIMGMPGNARLVQRLVDDHYVALYRYAYRLSGSAADAEDLTQEAFCKAQLCLSQLRQSDRAKPWLFSILRNAYLHRVRAERQAACVSLEGIGDVPDRLPDSLPDIDPERLQLALNELPEGFRTPLILFYFEDFSYRDIADQMDLPMGTVMSRLARAKTYLRTRLVDAAVETSANGLRSANGLGLGRGD